MDNDLGLVRGDGVDDVVEGGGVHGGLLEELPLQHVRTHVRGHVRALEVELK